MNSFVTPCRGSHELVYEILLSAGASNSGREGEQGRVLSLISARHDTMAETSRCNSSTALSAHDIKSGGTDGSGTDNTAWLTLISPAHEAESHFWTHGQEIKKVMLSQEEQDINEKEAVKDIYYPSEVCACISLSLSVFHALCL